MVKRSKSPVSFRIFGVNLVPEDVTRELGISPTYVHHLGERFNPRYSAFEHGMWSLASSLDSDMSLEAHLDALLQTLVPKSAYLYLATRQ